VPLNNKIQNRLEENIARVRNLVTIYEKHLMGSGSGRRGHLETDVLRSAVVFLHASLEDFLRNIAYWKLPNANPEVIDSVPLKGHGGRASKFWLGALVPHKGKTVDDLLRESVEDYLERSNYNNTEEIGSFLESIGVDADKVNSDFPQLEKLMSRRHQIVHRADRDESGGSGKHKVRSIGRDSVREWAAAVESFADKVLTEVKP